MWSLGSVLLLCFVGSQAYDWDEPTALDDYVNYDDGMFSWSLIGEYRYEEDGVTTYLLNMTSQKWMDENFSSQPIWWHMMGVCIPDEIKGDIAYLWIEGGSNSATTTPPAPDAWVSNLVRSSTNSTGYISAYVLQVPNQRIQFPNDPSGRFRGEDALIAWTWYTYLNDHQKQPEVILRLPMTKAGKRALDAIHEFVPTIVPDLTVDRFVVGGGSKRGWTAWSVAATDRRVIAATPAVMSLLNFNDTLQSHYRNLGGWTFAFIDYYELNLTQHFHDDLVVNWDYGIWTYEDMFRYKERLDRIPWLMVSAGGDEFFLPTDSSNWYHLMNGDRWIMMNPNVEHTLVPLHQRIGETISSFMIYLNNGQTMPKLTWLRGETTTGARISLFVDTVPDEITAWYATTWRNETAKDFRLLKGYEPTLPHPVVWRRKAVTNLGNGQYEAELDRPDVGFGGIFIECIWTRLTGMRMVLTTEVQFTPDTFPFPGCFGAACYGTLV